MADRVVVSELEKAIQTLQESLQFSSAVKDDEIKFKIARDACIQRFEYCIELSWKVSLRKLGSATKFPKPAIRDMARGSLIDDPNLWIEFVDARNESSHSYDEKVATRVFAAIQKFLPEAEKLLERLKNFS